MRKTLALCISFFIVTFLAPGLVHAAEKTVGPLEMVRSASDAILGRVIADKKQISENRSHVVDLINDLLIPHIDEITLAKRVLGDNWAASSVTQQEKFTLEFRRYLVRFYAQVLLLYSGEKVEYSAVEKASQPGVRKVSSLISRSGEVPIEAAYRVELRDEIWKVTDIIVDGISLVQANQAQFKHMIARDGLDKVSSMLEARNNRPFR